MRPQGQGPVRKRSTRNVAVPAHLVARPELADTADFRYPAPRRAPVGQGSQPPSISAAPEGVLGVLSLLSCHRHPPWTQPSHASCPLNPQLVPTGDRKPPGGQKVKGLCLLLCVSQTPGERGGRVAVRAAGRGLRHPPPSRSGSVPCRPLPCRVLVGGATVFLLRWLHLKTMVKKPPY